MVEGLCRPDCGSRSGGWWSGLRCIVKGVGWGGRGGGPGGVGNIGDFFCRGAEELC